MAAHALCRCLASACADRNCTAALCRFSSTSTACRRCFASRHSTPLHSTPLRPSVRLSHRCCRLLPLLLPPPLLHLPLPCDARRLRVRRRTSCSSGCAASWPRRSAPLFRFSRRRRRMPTALTARMPKVRFRWISCWPSDATVRPLKGPGERSRLVFAPMYTWAQRSSGLLRAAMPRLPGWHLCAYHVARGYHVACDRRGVIAA